MRTLCNPYNNINNGDSASSANLSRKVKDVYQINNSFIFSYGVLYIESYYDRILIRCARASHKYVIDEKMSTYKT